MFWLTWTKTIDELSLASSNLVFKNSQFHNKYNQEPGSRSGNENQIQIQFGSY